MNGLVSKLGAVVLGLSLSGSAFAGERARELRQQERIEQGVRSGQLTRHEANVLERREERIHAQARMDRMEHHGRLTLRERTRLQREQNRVSRAIYDQKHDGQRR